MKDPFIWLASYPKSGNTWLRIVLANILDESATPVEINQIELGVPSNLRHAFEEAVGVEASELSDADIDRLRPRAYRHMAARASRTIFSKVHDAYDVDQDGSALFPADVTRAAVYIVRNPLDLVISCAYFFDTDQDTMIDRLGQQDYAMSNGTRGFQELLRQRLGSWSSHVRGWSDQTAFPVLVVRYEDMWLNPVDTFGAVCRFLELPASPPRVARAIEATRFDRLQQQEREHGFRENLSAAPVFFRSGQMEQWRTGLTPSQVTRVVRDHDAMMHRFGYLDAQGEPVVHGGAQ